jgi:hypothetical protein
MSSPTARFSSPPALAFRSVSLFVVLWQFRLLAGELADTGVFAAALFGAFTAGFFFGVRKIRPLPTILSIALIPWTVRLFIGLPRLFAGGSLNALIAWDSLLLNLDRNNFVTLFPFYWAALCTYGSTRSRRFLRADIAAAQIMILVLFVINRSADLAAYRWPALPIAVFSGVVFMQILALMLSLPPELRPQKAEKGVAALAVLLLVLAGGLLIIRPSQEQAVDRGGGLLQPNLFQFDFSQILRLESEIKMNDDLALIVRKDSGDHHIYTRRFTLSGYNAKQGFYRLEESDELVHPSRLPARRADIGAEISAGIVAGPPGLSRVVEQEYYLVNFDSTAFIGMNQPFEIIPFESWDASSFSSAYAVKSRVSEAGPFELLDAVPRTLARDVRGGEPRFTYRDLGMSAEEFNRYTEGAAPPRIAAAAAELAAGLDSYWDMVDTVHDWLRHGDFRYSLKPGIAADGDQLSHFLFVSKKGYCSYFAFAFAVMLRSLGIPCRVAVGFLIDMEMGAFDYYPVRSDMAHAWVEVYYPGFGWIDYDPTTDQLAADEEFNFSRGIPQDLFERLMREILENRARLREKEGEDAAARDPAFADLPRRAARFLRRAGLPLAVALITLLFMLTRCGALCVFWARRDARGKTRALWRHTRRRLALGGLKKKRDEGEAEWAARLDRTRDLAMYALYQDAAEARYAPHYGKRETTAAQEHYRVFSRCYGRALSPGRRALAWLCPPLALILPAGKVRESRKTINE